MSESMIGIGCIVLLFGLMLASVPVFVAMGISAFVGFLLIDSPLQSLTNMSNIIWQASSIFELVAIPLFIFTGILMGRIGAGRDLFNVTTAWVGNVPNALGVATITACGIFASICGSSIANAASVGLVAIPLLLEANYTKAQAGGFVAGGGTLGIIIPPSIPFILYGVITETSIGKLFMAGVIPGIIMMLLFIVYVTRSRPRILQKLKMPMVERIAVSRRAIGVLLLPVIIIGAIYTGIFTPTEVAALAVAYVVMLGIVQRRLNFGVFLGAAKDATKTTAMLLMLIIFGQYFAHFLTFEQLPQAMASWITGLSGNHFIIVSVMILVFILLGSFLESAAMLLISVPIFFPIAQSIGMDPIVFGVFCCIAMEIAQIHPPIGINLFTIHGISRIPLWDLSKGAFPFVLIQFVMLYAVWLFPQMSLWIPNHMMLH